MAHFTGNPGDDSITGTSADDEFDVSQGGEDTLIGGGGTDSFHFGAMLDAGDHVDGGNGDSDALYLDGDYSGGLVFTDTTVVNVEFIALGADHSYDLTLANATADLDHGDFLWVLTDQLTAEDQVVIDASAFAADHRFVTATWAANETLIGGAGDDQVQVEGAGLADFSGGAGDDSVFLDRTLARGDRLDGGEGADDLSLTIGGQVTFSGKMLKAFDSITLVAGSYDLTMSDGNLAAGETLYVTANNLTRGQLLAFDGSAERSGSYIVIGSQGDDTLTAGGGGDSLEGQRGDDIIHGGGGADTIYGGAGRDTFVYAKLSDSGHHKQFDLIYDLTGFDRIDLSAIDADTAKGGNQAFHQVDAFTGHAGELVLTYDVTINATTIAGDVNGDGHADIAIRAWGEHLEFTNFAL